MTNEQIRRTYNTRMQNILRKNARIKQDQDDADRAAFQKQQEANAKTSQKLALLGMYKDLKDSYDIGMVGATYEGDITAAGRPLKFTRKDPRSIGEVIDPRNIGETAKRLLPGGQYEKTEDYKKFKLGEDLKTSKSGVDPESLVGAIDPKTGEQITGKGYDALIKSRGIESDLAKMDIADVDDAIFKKHGLTKEDAQELVNILEEKGITLKEGVLDQEQTVKLLSKYNETIKQQGSLGGRVGEDEMLPSEAFEEALRKTEQNPDMLPAVVTDLTENTDKTLKAITQETYTPGQEPTGKLTYDEWMTSEDPDGDLQINPYSGNITEKTIGERYAMDELGAIPDRPDVAPPVDEEFIVPGQDTLEYAPEQLKGIEAASDLAQDQQLQKLRDIEKPSSLFRSAPGTSSPSDPYGSSMNERLVKGKVAAKMGITMPEVSPEMEKALQEMEGVFDEEGKVVPEKKGLFDLFKKDKEVGDMTASASDSDVFAHTGEKLGDTTVPDAKPDGKFVGKALGALQTLKSMQDIGKTLTDEEVSGADKALAGTQGVKMLSDLAAKRAGQETASQIGGKAATQFLKGKGLQEGVKLGGKAAVGAAAGGVIGGYTMVAEGKAAGESWEEGDYDEAILHGIGSVSGGLQTAGAGMMLTGIGAPLGAVLYGVGTAASVISSGALLLEGLFGGDGSAPVVPEVKKPKFNAGRYLQTIRDNRRYAY